MQKTMILTCGLVIADQILIKMVKNQIDGLSICLRTTSGRSWLPECGDSGSLKNNDGDMMIITIIGDDDEYVENDKLNDKDNMFKMMLLKMMP